MSNGDFFAEVTKRSTAAASAESKKAETVKKEEPAKKETTAVVKTEDVTTSTAPAPSTSTTTNTRHDVAVHAPVIQMHVPSPTVHIEAGKFPGVWAVLAQAQLAVLHMVLGASLFAVFGRKLMTVAGL